MHTSRTKHPHKLDRQIGSEFGSAISENWIARTRDPIFGSNSLIQFFGQPASLPPSQPAGQPAGEAAWPAGRPSSQPPANAGARCPSRAGFTLWLRWPARQLTRRYAPARPPASCHARQVARRLVGGLGHAPATRRPAFHGPCEGHCTRSPVGSI